MKRDEKWVVPRNKNYDDPRVAIARHIGWSKNTAIETDYSLPEPDHFNYAGLAAKPIECPFLTNQVFYQDKKSLNWWTVYFVPEEQDERFVAWADPIEYIVRWTPYRLSRMRQRRGLLWTKPCTAEQTAHERLYTMGYYENLQTTFNIDITNRLGKPRDDMPQGEYV